MVSGNRGGQAPCMKSETSVENSVGRQHRLSTPGTDGPANVLAAVRVAASAVARGLGVLVVFNDEIHAARFVSKSHASKPSAFQSRIVGPIGWLSEGHLCLAAPRRHRPYRSPCAASLRSLRPSLALAIADEPG
jgi:L-asparaginase